MRITLNDIKQALTVKDEPVSLGTIELGNWNTEGLKVTYYNSNKKHLIKYPESWGTKGK